MSPVEQKALMDSIKDRLAKLPTDPGTSVTLPTVSIPAPVVHNHAPKQAPPVVNVEVAPTPITVNVDLAPIAEALLQINSLNRLTIQRLVDAYEHNNEMLSQLLQVLAEMPQPINKVRVPDGAIVVKVEQPPPALPAAREPITLTIEHSDGQTSTVRG